jgi:prepilin-type N-terminal cleavage/methylation domain-containing protein
MNKSKGFTIIELIVVIAIIAVLAAIVMVNVTSYIAKGKDVSIRGNLSSALTNAAVYFDTTSNYTTVCADTVYGFQTAYNAAAAISAAESCADTTTQWCACAQLVSDTAKYFCVDYTGTKKETAITCATDCADGSDYVCDGL